MGSIRTVALAGPIRPTEGPFPTVSGDVVPTQPPLSQPQSPGIREPAPATPLVQYVSQTIDLRGKSLDQQTAFFSQLLSRTDGPRTISVELLSAGDPAVHQLTIQAIDGARRMRPGSRIRFEALLSGMKPGARTCRMLGISAEQTAVHNADLRVTASPVIQKRALAAISRISRSPAFDKIAIDDHALFTAADLNELSKVSGQTVPQLQTLSLTNLTALVATIKRFGKTPTMSVGGVSFTQSATGLSNAAFIRRIGLANGIYEVQLYTENNASLSKALRSLMSEARADPSAFGSLAGLRVALAATANHTKIGPRQLRDQQKMVAEFARDFFENTGVKVSTALWDGTRYLSQMKGSQEAMR